MEVREVELILESDLGTPRPDALLNLLFTIENRGNVDMTLMPSLSLPTGWSVQTPLQAIEMGWTEQSKNILISIQGNGNALSGPIQLNLDVGTERFSWSDTLNVLELPQPSLTFSELEFENGETFDHPFGPGAHPAGQEMTFTWLLINEADVAWSPSISTSFSLGVFGECADVPTITNDVVPVVCSVILPLTLEVGSQPSFSFTLYDDEVSITEGTSMLVAEQRSVEWEITGLSSLDDTGSGTIQVRVLNTGNIALSHQLLLETSDGLDASIVGEDIVNAVAGDSQQFTIQLTGTSKGMQQLSLEVSGIHEVETSSTAIDIDITASFDTTDSKGNIPLLVGTGIALVFGFLAVLIVVLRAKGAKIQPPATAPLIQPPSQQPAPTCWSCRSPILGPMKGCPGCGARYHADLATCQSVDACTNCGASSEGFVSA